MIGIQRVIIIPASSSKLLFSATCGPQIRATKSTSSVHSSMLSCSDAQTNLIQDEADIPADTTLILTIDSLTSNIWTGSPTDFLNFTAFMSQAFYSSSLFSIFRPFSSSKCVRQFCSHYGSSYEEFSFMDLSLHHRNSGCC